MVEVEDIRGLDKVASVLLEDGQAVSETAYNHRLVHHAEGNDVYGQTTLSSPIAVITHFMRVSRMGSSGRR